jgi:5-methylcytosine-specific restriction endonuclease McrA
MSKSYISVKKKRIVHERAFGCCEYCQCIADFVPDTLPIEHIIPESKSGSNELDNLALACQACNGSKYDKIYGIDLTTEMREPLFNPRLQNWNEHFKWNEDFLKLLQ